MKSFYKILLFTFLLVTSCTNGPSSVPAEITDKELTIFITNDIHGKIDNFAKVKYLVDEEKKKQAKERIQRKAHLLLDLSRQYVELRRFVNAMVLGGNELSEGEGINLLTVHARKGLDFPEV